MWINFFPPHCARRCSLFARACRQQEGQFGKRLQHCHSKSLRSAALCQPNLWLFLGRIFKMIDSLLTIRFQLTSSNCLKRSRSSRAALGVSSLSTVLSSISALADSMVLRSWSKTEKKLEIHSRTTTGNHAQLDKCPDNANFPPRLQFDAVTRQLSSMATNPFAEPAAACVAEKR